MTTTATVTKDTTSLGTRIDVRILLSALWTTMLLVFAYVDIFGFYRADVLEAALEGRIASTAFVVNQTSLTATLGYILVPTLMVTLSLVLTRRVNRVLTIVVAAFYAVMIMVSCIGETWIYYWVGSLVEVSILVAIIRTAWGRREQGA